jgi:hypothetical protein
VGDSREKRVRGKRYSMGYAVQRRSQRVLLDVPLVIRGEQDDNGPFQEETFTVTVSAHGALLMLATKVHIGQRLMLRNPENSEERDGRVAYIGREHAGLAQVAIEFTRPAPEFWPITTPPKDWQTSG